MLLGVKLPKVVPRPVDPVNEVVRCMPSASVNSIVTSSTLCTADPAGVRTVNSEIVLASSCQNDNSLFFGGVK